MVEETFCTKTFRKEKLGFDAEEKKAGTLLYAGEKWFTWRTPVMTVIFDPSSDGEKKVSLSVGLNPETSKTGARFAKIMRILDSRASAGVLKALPESTQYFPMHKKPSPQQIRLQPVAYFNREDPSRLSLRIRKEATGETIEAPSLDAFRRLIQRNVRVRCVLQCGRSWHYGTRAGVSVILREIEVLKPEKPQTAETLDLTRLSMSGGLGRFRSVLDGGRPFVVALTCPVVGFEVVKNERGDHFLALSDKRSLALFTTIDRAVSKLHHGYRGVVFKESSVRFKIDPGKSIVREGDKKMKALSLKAKRHPNKEISSLSVECRCAYFTNTTQWTVSWLVRKLRVSKD